MIKNELVEAIHQQVGGLSSREIWTYVTYIIDEVSETLAHGESVKLTNFGVFEPYDKKARMGRNPKTLEDAEISARRVVRFRMSENVCDILNHSEDDK
jgi:integration host factor subunit alpha